MKAHTLCKGGDDVENTNRSIISRVVSIFNRNINALPRDARMVRDCFGDNAYANYIIYSNELESAKAYTNGLL